MVGEYAWNTVMLRVLVPRKVITQELKRREQDGEVRLVYGLQSNSQNVIQRVMLPDQPESEDESEDGEEEAEVAVAAAEDEDEVQGQQEEEQAQVEVEREAPVPLYAPSALVERDLEDAHTPQRLSSIAEESFDDEPLMEWLRLRGHSVMDAASAELLRGMDATSGMDASSAEVF